MKTVIYIMSWKCDAYIQGLSQGAPLRQSCTVIEIVPYKNSQQDNLSPSKFTEKLERKCAQRDLVQYSNCKLKQNVEGVFYRTLLLHIVRSKFILKSCFSHTVLNTHVSGSTKHGELTWQFKTCHNRKLFRFKPKLNWIREKRYRRWTVY